jgi:hypothetical protein
MARKTAMGKEPGNVSIALPKSEKDRLRSDGQRLPGKSRPMDDKGNFTDKQSLERVSPGIYRNSQGKLVGSKGQALPKRSPIQNALQGVAQAAGQQAGMQANIQGVAQAAGMEGGRMPAGRPGQGMSQQEVDAAMQARNLANSFMEQYPNSGMGNQQIVPYPMQIQSGILQTQPGQAPMQMQNLMYPWANGKTPPDMRLFAPYNPQGINTIQNAQPQAVAQPNSISGLLRRGR